VLLLEGHSKAGNGQATIAAVQVWLRLLQVVGLLVGLLPGQGDPQH
jgi:hypothetical protein